MCFDVPEVNVAFFEVMYREESISLSCPTRRM